MKGESLVIPVSSSIFLHLILGALVFFNTSFDSDDKPAPTISTSSPSSVNKKVKTIDTVVLDKAKVDDLVDRIRKKKKADTDKRKALEKRLAQLEAKQKTENKKTAAAIKKRKEADKKAKLAEKKRKEAQKKQRLEEKKRLAAEKQTKEQQEKAKLAADNNRKESLLLEQQRKERAIEEAKTKVLADKRIEEELQRQRQKELEEQMLEEQRAIAAERRQFVLSEVDKFKALIHDKIRSNLIAGVDAVVDIRLAPGGLVIDVNCTDGDVVACRDAVVAVKKSGLLPVSKDPEVFKQLREIRLTLNELR